MTKRWSLLGGGVAVLVLGAVVLVGCTSGGDAPVPDATGASGTASATTSDEPEGWTRAEIEALVLDGDIGTSTVLGSVDGAVPDPTTPVPATIEVTEVVAGEASTLVRFTLVGAADSDPLLALGAFNALRPLARDIRDIAIVDAARNLRLQPFLGMQVSDPDVVVCTCASAPLQLSTAGQLLSGTFPPLDPGTTTISVEVPGFAPVEDVPVTRHDS